LVCRARKGQLAPHTSRTASMAGATAGESGQAFGARTEEVDYQPFAGYWSRQAAALAAAEAKKKADEEQKKKDEEEKKRREEEQANGPGAPTGPTPTPTPTPTTPGGSPVPPPPTP